MAILLYYNKHITPEGDIIKWKVWKVDKSKYFPDGVKYSLAYIHKNKKIIGYDNERAKGHHKHYFEKEESYIFVDVKKLFRDFEDDVKKLRGILYGKKEN